MTSIRVVIADDVSNTREDIKRLLYFEDDIEVVGEAGNGNEAVNTVRELKPDVILMDINMPELDGIGATEKISLENAETAVIIISIQGEKDYLRKAMAAGAREYLVKPFSSDELSETIRRVHDSNKKRVEQQFSQQAKPVTPLAPKGKVISFFCTKGGVGKTSLAANFAVTLAEQTRKKIALLDLDLGAGDCSIMLNISVKSTIADMVQEQDTFDFPFINSFIVPHMSGVCLLPAPLSPEQAELVHWEHIEQIIKILVEGFDYIIVDTAPIYNDISLKVLEMSDNILLVMDQDITTLKHVKTAMDIFNTLNYTSKVRLILNKFNSEGIKTRDIESTLKIAVTGVIPEDPKTVRNAINKGLPFVLSRRNSQLTAAVNQLVDLLKISKTKQSAEPEIKRTKTRTFLFKKSGTVHGS
jgi:pilus assembly protein CpaE